MRARIGYSFGAVRDARADRGARDVASRVDPRPLRTPPKNGSPSIIPLRAKFSFARRALTSPPRPAPSHPRNAASSRAPRSRSGDWPTTAITSPRRSSAARSYPSSSTRSASRTILQAGCGVCPEGGGQALAPARAGRGGQPRLSGAVPRGVRPGRQGIRRVGPRPSRDTTPTSPAVVEAGAVPLLVLCVQEPELSLKRIAASSLSDIAKHSPEMAQAVVDAGAVAYLAPLILSPDAKLRGKCARLGQVAKPRSISRRLSSRRSLPEHPHVLQDVDGFVRKHAARRSARFASTRPSSRSSSCPTAASPRWSITWTSPRGTIACRASWRWGTSARSARRWRRR